MDYKADILRMVQEMQNTSILKKLHKFTRLMWRAECDPREK